MIEIPEESIKDKFIKLGFLSAFLVAFDALLLTLLFSTKEVATTNNVTIFTLYSAVIGIPLIFLAIFVFGEKFFKKTPLSFINYYIHEPEKGLLNIFGGIKIKSVFKFAWFSLLASLIFALLLSTIVPTGQPLTSFSTPIDKLSLNNQVAEIVLATGGANAETLIYSSILMGLMFGTSLVLANTVKNPTGSKILFALLLIIGMLIVGFIFGFIYHNARYGTDEKAILSVTLFGFVLPAIVMIMTGSVIFPLIFHVVLNMMSKAIVLFATNEIVLTIVISLIIVSMIILTLSYAFRRKNVQTA